MDGKNINNFIMILILLIFLIKVNLHNSFNKNLFLILNNLKIQLFITKLILLKIPRQLTRDYC